MFPLLQLDNLAGLFQNAAKHFFFLYIQHCFRSLFYLVVRHLHAAPGLFCLYTVYIRTKLLLPVQSALFGALFL